MKAHDIDGTANASAGLDMADTTNGVSVVHSTELNHYAPTTIIQSNTNGDNLEETRSIWKTIFEKLFGEKDENPAAASLDPKVEQFKAANREAKLQLFANQTIRELDIRSPNPGGVPEKTRSEDSVLAKMADYNPDGILSVATLRCQDEKLDAHKALTEENLSAWTRAGNNQILFANVQGDPKDPENASMQLFLHFREIQEAINARADEHNHNLQPGDRPHGYLAVITGFDKVLQRTVLTAADVELAFSQRMKLRGTEAAGLTEMNGPATGALLFTTPFIEAIFQLFGERILWNAKGWLGWLFFPSEDTEEGYREEMMKAIQEYYTDRDTFVRRQIRALRIANIFNALLTMAGYFKIISVTKWQETRAFDFLSQCLRDARKLVFFKRAPLRNSLIKQLREKTAAREPTTFEFQKINPGPLGNPHRMAAFASWESPTTPQLTLVRIGEGSLNLKVDNLNLPADEREDLRRRMEQDQTEAWVGANEEVQWNRLFDGMGIAQDGFVQVIDAVTQQPYQVYPVREILKSGLRIKIPKEHDVQVLTLRKSPGLEIKEAALPSALSVFNQYQIDGAMVPLIEQLVPPIPGTHSSEMSFYSPTGDVIRHQDPEGRQNLFVVKGDGKLTLSLRAGTSDSRRFPKEGSTFYLELRLDGNTLWIEDTHFPASVGPDFIQDWFEDQFFPWAMELGFKNVNLLESSRFKALKPQTLRASGFRHTRSSYLQGRNIWTRILEKDHSMFALTMQVDVRSFGVAWEPDTQGVYRAVSMNSLEALQNQIHRFSSMGVFQYVLRGIHRISPLSQAIYTQETVGSNRFTSANGNVVVWANFSRPHEIVDVADNKYLRSYSGSSNSLLWDESGNPVVQEPEKLDEVLETIQNAQGIATVELTATMSPDSLTDSRLDWVVKKPLSQEELQYYRSLSEEGRLSWLDEHQMQHSGYFAYRSHKDQPAQEEVYWVAHARADGFSIVDEVFLNPYHPAVRNHLLKQIKRLIDQGVKGIHIRNASVLLKQNVDPWLRAQGVTGFSSGEQQEDLLGFLIREAKAYVSGRTFLITIADIQDESEIRRMKELGADYVSSNRNFAEDFSEGADLNAARVTDDLTRLFNDTHFNARGGPYSILGPGTYSQRMPEGEKREALAVLEMVLANIGVPVIVRSSDLLDAAPAIADPGTPLASPEDIRRQVTPVLLERLQRRSRGLLRANLFHHWVDDHSQTETHMGLNSSDGKNLVTISWEQPGKGDVMLFVWNLNRKPGEGWVELPLEFFGHDVHVNDIVAVDAVADTVVPINLELSPDTGHWQKRIPLKWDLKQPYALFRIIKNSEEQPVKPEMRQQSDDSLQGLAAVLNVITGAQRADLRVFDWLSETLLSWGAERIVTELEREGLKPEYVWDYWASTTVAGQDDDAAEAAFRQAHPDYDARRRAAVQRELDALRADAHDELLADPAKTLHYAYAFTVRPDAPDALLDEILQTLKAIQSLAAEYEGRVTADFRIILERETGRLPRFQNFVKAVNIPRLSSVIWQNENSAPGLLDRFLDDNPNALFYGTEQERALSRRHSDRFVNSRVSLGSAYPVTLKVTRGLAPFPGITPDQLKQHVPDILPAIRVNGGVFEITALALEYAYGEKLLAQSA